MYRIFRDIHFADPIISLGAALIATILWIARFEVINRLSGWRYTVVVVGIALLVFGGTLFLIEILRRLSGLSREESELENGQVPTLPAAPNSNVKFYHDRTELPALIPWLEQFHEIWCAFNVGFAFEAQGVFANEKIKITKLILLDPNSPYLKQFQSQYTSRNQNAQESIKTTTAVAIKHRVQVRWFNGLMTNTILGNPEKQDSRILWEILMPSLPFHGKRPGFEIINDPESLKIAKEYFDEMWRESRDPEKPISSLLEMSKFPSAISPEEQKIKWLEEELSQAKKEVIQARTDERAAQFELARFLIYAAGRSHPEGLDVLIEFENSDDTDLAKDIKYLIDNGSDISNWKIKIDSMKSWRDNKSETTRIFVTSEDGEMAHHVVHALAKSHKIDERIAVGDNKHPSDKDKDVVITIFRKSKPK